MVKYPGFRFLSEENFVAYHEHHARSITVVVLPLMAAELILATWLFVESSCTWERLIPLFLVVDIWVSTFMIQVPLHGKLSDKKDDEAIEKLIRSNWIRTILWTLEVGWLVNLAI